VLGTWLSAYFIIAANSFMQNPVGYSINSSTGDAQLVDIGQVLFQPLTVWAWLHTIIGGVIAATVFVFGVSAYHLKRRQHVDIMWKSFKAAMITGILAGGLQFVVGDALGVVMVDKQPMKMAAAEAVWETTGPCASLGIIAIPNMQARDNSFEVGVPCLLSVLATNSLDGEVTGMNELQTQYEEQFGPGNYTPNVWISFYSFRAMMGFGLVGAVWMLFALWKTRKRHLPTARWFWAISIWIIAAPWLGNLFGWIFTENGRQPWVVYGLLKTQDAVSNLSTALVASSLIGFVLVYAVIGIVEFRLMRRYVIRGPQSIDEPMPGEPPKVTPSLPGGLR
jgi:cytochrome d ubiquinol oxidase subunit I